MPFGTEPKLSLISETSTLTLPGPVLPFSHKVRNLRLFSTAAPTQLLPFWPDSIIIFLLVPFALLTLDTLLSYAPTWTDTETHFSFFGPSIWNSLPKYLRDVPSLLSFKSSLKTFMFNKYLKWFSCFQFISSVGYTSLSLSDSTACCHTAGPMCVWDQSSVCALVHMYVCFGVCLSVRSCVHMCECI